MEETNGKQFEKCLSVAINVYHVLKKLIQSDVFKTHKFFKLLSTSFFQSLRLISGFVENHSILNSFSKGNYPKIRSQMVSVQYHICVSSWRKKVYRKLKYFWVLRTSYCFQVLPLRNFCNISGFRNINMPSSYIECSPRNMYTSLFLCLVILYPSVVILLSCHILFWNFGLFIYLQQHLYIYKNPLLKLT